MHVALVYSIKLKNLLRKYKPLLVWFSIKSKLYINDLYLHMFTFFNKKHSTWEDRADTNHVFFSGYDISWRTTTPLPNQEDYEEVCIQDLDIFRIINHLEGKEVVKRSRISHICYWTMVQK